MKRALDLALTVLTAPLWMPLLALTALVVAVTMGRPVLYVSERAGKGGRVFRFLKLRTMRAPRFSGEGDAARLTRVGRVLRALSLDELPQFFHVLSGRMSLVGPRPLPGAYLPRYSAFQRRRHEVRPGITGWAQVCGRNALSWERKFELDVWYVDHRSLALDLKILALTLWRVLGRSGVNHGKCDTMYEFTGGDR